MNEETKKLVNELVNMFDDSDDKVRALDIIEKIILNQAQELKKILKETL